MLDRYNAFDVTSKSIRSELTLFETNSSQVVSILDNVDRCDGVRVYSHLN